MARGNKFDVAVIGGGPAGLMAAGAAAKLGAKVILIEKNKGLGKKFLLTGNGRCNITNAEFNLKKLAENYGKNGKFLLPAFYDFGPKQTINFFNSLGIKTKIENNNRVFPASEKASDVLSALKNYLLKNKVNISLDSRVLKIICEGNRIKKLILKNREVIAEKYVLCTGGKSYPLTGSTGDGYKWLKDLGHHITELSPALVPVRLKENWAKDLQGLALKDVKICILQNNKKHSCERGHVLFAHFGLSGPSILNMSKKIGKLLKLGQVKISLDILPDSNIENLEKEIREKINKNPKKTFRNLLSNFIPQRLVDVFIEIIGIKADKQVNNITKEERRSIAKLLKNVEITAAELLGFDLAVVTSGGVSLKEIENKTMKSKIINNLYFSGEIIDIDGITGGFNLQACWSTGHLAGKSATR